MFRYAILLLFVMTATAHAATFQTIQGSATILYDGPSQKARPLFLYGSNIPVEVISTIEGWSKVRDSQGAIGWIERSKLSDKRMLQVRVPVARAFEQPSDNAPLAFEAEENVLLELDETATSPATTLTPGWVRVRHQDGQAGFVRISSIFGL